MKRIFFLFTLVAVAVSCGNQGSSKRQNGGAPELKEDAPVIENVANPAEEPEVNPEAEPEAEPAVEQPKSVEQSKAVPHTKAVEKKVETPITPLSQGTVTVDGLCQKFGVYSLVSEYDRSLKNEDKKAARTVERQLKEILTQVKNDEALPKELRKSFKDYVEAKQEEIRERY